MIDKRHTQIQTIIKEGGSLGDLGFCNSCLDGFCIPGIKKHLGVDVKVNGCVAALLYYSGLISMPEKLCDCFNLKPQAHPRDRFGQAKLKTQQILNDDVGIYTGNAMVNKSVVDDE